MKTKKTIIPPASAFLPLDEEERELMQAMENNEFVRDEQSEERMKENVLAAKNTLKKKPITIRLQQGDINLIKKLANFDGIPYQTLIGSVIHRYAQGTLKRAD